MDGRFTIPSHGRFMAATVSHINLDTYWVNPGALHAHHWPGRCENMCVPEMKIAAQPMVFVVFFNQETKPMAFKTNMLHEFTRYYDSYNM